LPTPLELAHVALIGAGATAVMDAWGLLLKRLGVPASNFALVGRWVGHLARGPIGVATVAMPLLVMQPAMGAGFAASKTPAPLQNCLRSLANHAVFGGGLYLAALLLNSLTNP
jgi:hypothetical protein